MSICEGIEAPAVKCCAWNVSSKYPMWNRFATRQVNNDFSDRNPCLILGVLHSSSEFEHRTDFDAGPFSTGNLRRI